jgi:type VI secretion system protein ImpE
MSANTNPNPSPHLNIHHLGDTLAQVEASVRKEPSQDKHRWALVEILCVMGHWERALRQLQALVKLAPQWQSQAHLVRGLIRAETQRNAVFSGAQMPVPVIDLPDWMHDLAHALHHNARGEHPQADLLRTSALERAPTSAGTCSVHQLPIAAPTAHAPPRTAAAQEHSFEWLADSDTRLGPVCEVMAAGAYRWLAFADIAHLHLEAPTRLLDLVWLPAKMQLRGGPAASREIHGYLPARYPLVSTETNETTAATTPAPGHASDDALLLARITRWHDVGDTGVFAQGQKTWMTEGIDWPLLDIREIRT